MTSSSESRALGALLVLAAILWLPPLQGCSSDERPQTDDAQTERDRRPLQPLIYTERPELSPHAARVRERRLMRKLLEGSSQGEWGELEHDTRDLPELSSAEVLGRAIFDALLERDEALWDHTFVSPSGYAALVHVEMPRARRFVDELQGESMPLWRIFAVERPSEIPVGGLSSIFAFEELALGDGRDASGSRVDEEARAVQYWNNELRLELRGHETTFTIPIPKIVRPPGDDGRPGALGLASPLRLGEELEIFFRAGLHLKPRLLRPEEYPFPLAVGNFWRYERHRPDESVPPTRELVRPAPGPVAEGELPGGRVADAPPRRRRGGLEASQRLLEVTEVDRHGAVRLVTLRQSYDDSALTHHTLHWLVTPRLILDCSSQCVRSIDDLGRLLDYMRREIPLLRFPPRHGLAWGDGGVSRRDDPDRSEDDAPAVHFRIHNDSPLVEVPAGNFPGVYRIQGSAPSLTTDAPLGAVETLERYFAPGKGVVRRVLRRPGDEETPVVLEDLVEYRIMP
jgi:hypothetical protein